MKHTMQVCDQELPNVKVQNVEQFGIIFSPLLCNITFFNMLAFSFAEHLEIGFPKLWVVSLRICSVDYFRKWNKNL
jgi:hypothetical protein